ncbi:MAG: hypothetical protein ACLPIX_05710 [Rhodomicrobium sp.]
MALNGVVKFPAVLLAAILALSAPALAQHQGGNIFTVANVKAEAEAANSVEAKKLATQTAQTRAFHQLISRLVDFRSQPRIPELSPEEVERLVSDIEIRGEGVSGTGYVANFGVSFSERAVEALFARYGIVPILDRGPEILIVPVYIEDGTTRAGDRNPWRSALLSLDLTHALVPAKVAPVRGDITAAIANAYIANPAAGVETLKSQYHASQILLAVASTGGGDEVTLKLAGNDALGQLAVQRKVKGADAEGQPLIEAAARLAFETVQQRWKLTRDSFVQADSGGGGETPAGNSGYMSGAVSSLQIIAQYSGLKEWQTIRTRLQKLPGIQNWDLKSVNPRSAQISLDFPGGADRLSAMAAGQGLSVEKGPDGLVVKTR